MADSSLRQMKCQGVVEGRECGSLLPENSKFCPECGTPAIPTGTISCPCGIIVRGQHKFCYNCGQPVQLLQELVSTPGVCTAEVADGAVCGYTLIGGLDFCPKCGSRKSDQKQDTANSTGKEKDPESQSSSAAAPSSSGGRLTSTVETSITSRGNEPRPQLFSQYADMEMVSKERISIINQSMISNIHVEQELKQQSSNITQEAVVLKTPVAVTDPGMTDADQHTAKETEPLVDAEQVSEAASSETLNRNREKNANDEETPHAPSDSENSIASRTRSRAPIQDHGEVTDHPLMEKSGNQESVPSGEKRDEVPRSKKDGGEKDQRELSKKEQSEQNEKEHDEKGEREAENTKEDKTESQQGDENNQSEEADDKNNNNNNSNINKILEGAVGGAEPLEKGDSGSGKMKTRSSDKSSMNYAAAVKAGPRGQKEKNVTQKKN